MARLTYILQIGLVILFSSSTLVCQSDIAKRENRANEGGSNFKSLSAASKVHGNNSSTVANEKEDLSELPSPSITTPESLFDAARNRFNPVEVSIEVKAETPELESAAPAPFVIGGEEIITAAGSYGDVMRYLQVLPGVVATSDTGNEVLVRGGHPIENLYLVEGFEIPNINHMARLGSTGGVRADDRLGAGSESNSAYRGLQR